jgi:hypothetical protein
MRDRLASRVDTGLILGVSAVLSLGNLVSHRPVGDKKTWGKRPVGNQRLQTRLANRDEKFAKPVGVQ